MTVSGRVWLPRQIRQAKKRAVLILAQGKELRQAEGEYERDIVEVLHALALSDDLLHDNRVCPLIESTFLQKQWRSQMTSQ